MWVFIISNSLIIDSHRSFPLISHISYLRWLDQLNVMEAFRKKQEVLNNVFQVFWLGTPGGW